MNIETGEIKRFNPGDVVPENFWPVKEESLTTKQVKKMQVSAHDNKSVLGKVFTSERKKRKWLAKQIKGSKK